MKPSEHLIDSAIRHFLTAEVEAVYSELYDTVVVCVFDETDVAFDAMKNFGLSPEKNLDYRRALEIKVRRQLIKTGDYKLLKKRRAQAKLLTNRGSSYTIIN